MKRRLAGCAAALTAAVVLQLAASGPATAATTQASTDQGFTWCSDADFASGACLPFSAVPGESAVDAAVADALAKPGGEDSAEKFFEQRGSENPQADVQEAEQRSAAAVADDQERAKSALAAARTSKGLAATMGVGGASGVSWSYNTSGTFGVVGSDGREAIYDVITIHFDLSVLQDTALYAYFSSKYKREYGVTNFTCRFYQSNPTKKLASWSKCDDISGGTATGILSVPTTHVITRTKNKDHFGRFVFNLKPVISGPPTLRYNFDSLSFHVDQQNLGHF